MPRKLVLLLVIGILCARAFSVLSTARQTARLPKERVNKSVQFEAVQPTTEIRARYFYAKRALDLGMGLSLLLITLPFWLVIAIAIRLTSKGPILFKQERIGAHRVLRNGKVEWVVESFVMYKFRTMYTDLPDSIHRDFVKAYIKRDQATMIAVNNGDTTFKITRDPRVTPIGRILRKTSLDELPQLLNVITGEMSLVGPRPALDYEYEEYEDWHKERLAAKPGITGYWQATSRNEVDFDTMVRQDIHYVRKQSVWLDLRILLMTPVSVLKGRGAA